MLTLQTVQNLKYNTNNAYNTYNIKAKKKNAYNIASPTILTLLTSLY